MKTNISQFEKIDEGVYKVVRDNIDIAPFLGLIKNYDAKELSNLLDHVLLMMVESQTSDAPLDGRDFFEMYFKVRMIKEAFENCEKTDEISTQADKVA